jgi:hypothetical protein
MSLDDVGAAHRPMVMDGCGALSPGNAPRSQHSQLSLRAAAPVLLFGWHIWRRLPALFPRGSAARSLPGGGPGEQQASGVTNSS